MHLCQLHVYCRLMHLAYAPMCNCPMSPGIAHRRSSCQVSSLVSWQRPFVSATGTTSPQHILNPKHVPGFANSTRHSCLLWNLTYTIYCAILACSVCVAAQVQVQRRETERQTEQRLNSYAFLSQQESDEKWKQLKCSAAESEVAAKVWDKLTTPAEQDAVSENLSRPHYLATIIPSQFSSPLLGCMTNYTGPCRAGFLFIISFCMCCCML